MNFHERINANIPFTLRLRLKRTNHLVWLRHGNKIMNKTNDVPFWPMIATIFLGTFAVMLSSSTINIALPFFMNHFQTDLDTVKWTMTGFTLAMGTTAPVTAFFGERYSYKRLGFLVLLWRLGLQLTIPSLQSKILPPVIWFERPTALSWESMMCIWFPAWSF